MIRRFYRSPITVETDLKSYHEGLFQQTKDGIDDAIVEAVIHCDIQVEKDELVRALNYDRGQWEEGYNAGYSEGLEKGKAEALARIKDLLEGGDEDD